MKMKHESKPFVYKVDARVHAMKLRDKGYKVSLTPADTYYKSRGWNWVTRITGVRKRKSSKAIHEMFKAGR